MRGERLQELRLIVTPARVCRRVAVSVARLAVAGKSTTHELDALDHREGEARSHRLQSRGRAIADEGSIKDVLLVALYADRRMDDGGPAKVVIVRVG
jgi:hypothetical protein